MPKALCISGMVIAVLLLLVFGVDLVIGFPFRSSSPLFAFKLMDIGFIICSGILGYLSWTTLREQV
ncbi:MAG: hypothetical protein ACYSWU_02625 [Planctomycetota bacterium]